MADEYLTPTQVGREIGITSQTVRNMIRAGRMQAVLMNFSKDRPRYRVRRSELERWLAEQTVGRRG